MIGIRNVPVGLMALDRPDDVFARPERQVPGSDVPAMRSEPAESRSHEEYYEALRVASDDDNGAADADRSGWDSVDAADRPKAEDIHASPERTTHILDGEPSGGGGHRHGVGKPGKTEFPASWDDEKIMGHVLDVVRRPDSAPVLQHRNNRWICSGTRDDVEVTAIVLRSGEIWTAWPEEGGPGVRRNPKKERS
jgi:Bacterial EndoU nuclease